MPVHLRASAIVQRHCAGIWCMAEVVDCWSAPRLSVPNSTRPNREKDAHPAVHLLRDTKKGLGSIRRAPNKLN